jgi:hypothetical protein
MMYLHCAALRHAVVAVQQAMLSAGCLPALVDLTSSPDAELRLNAVWALQNLVYTASAEVRSAVCSALSWRAVVDLTNDMQTDVQVGALCSPACPGRLLNSSVCSIQ